MQKKCILIVSSKESVLKYLSDFFEPKYTVLATAGGATALQMVQGMEIALIISDGNLKEMDGHAFCKMIKSNPYHSCIPLILLGSPRQLHMPSDISAAVGFNSPAQFSKNFKKQFGRVPSPYA